MKRLESPAFGPVLLDLIRRRYKTRRAFAQALALDPGWVTKLTGEETEGLSYASLERLFKAFPGPDEQDVLYRAWVRSYAPSPVQSLVPNSQSRSDLVVPFARSVGGWIAQGQSWEIFRHLRTLWHELSVSDRPMESFEVGTALVEVAQQLDRHSLAQSVTDELLALSRRQREPEWLCRALWQAAMNARLSRSAAMPRRFDDLDAYLQHWQPRGERVAHQWFTRTAARDKVLATLDLVRIGLNPAALEGPLKGLEAAIHQAEELGEQGVAREVAARALIFLGDFDQAARHLATSQTLIDSPITEIKLVICQAELNQAVGDTEEAAAQFLLALDLGDQWGLVHQRAKAAKLLHLLEQRSGVKV